MSPELPTNWAPSFASCPIIKQIILTSATIANPIELASGLIEGRVSLVDEDGAPRGPKQFLIYNPPIVNEDLGIRKSVLQESVRLAEDLLASTSGVLGLKSFTIGYDSLS